MKTITIVCQIGISILFLSSIVTIHAKAKPMLSIGATTKPKIAMKLAIKSGMANQENNIFITLNKKVRLQIMAKRAINAKRDLLKRLAIFLNCIQDKKITQKAFLVVGL